MLLADQTWSCFLLVALLAVGIIDCFERRIPNAMVLCVLASGLYYWTLKLGISGIGYALAGMTCGFLILVGFYAFGWLGAGDVKIFAAFGSVVGSPIIIEAGIFALIFGGLLALFYLGRGGLDFQLISGGRAMTRARNSGRTVPLGVALAAGVLAAQLGYRF